MNLKTDKIECDPKVEELDAWMVAFFEEMKEGCLKKASKRGAIDFEEMGRDMKKMFPNSPVDGVELAIFFYIRGKIARYLSSLLSGEVPDFDDLLDTHVYSMIALKYRETGKWI